jgi:hypothetical protein
MNITSDTSGDFDAFLASADAEFETEAEKKQDRVVPVEQRFNCASCGGTGRYRGVRVHQQEEQCFPCGGRGWHKLSPAARFERKQKREATIARNKQERIAALTETHGDLITDLRGMTGWNSFAASLISQLEESGKLSDNQLAAAQRMVHKVQLQRAEKAEQAKVASKVVGDVSAIQKLFDNALANGKKKRALIGARFERDANGEVVEGTKALNSIRLTPARAPRRDIWVNVDGTFCGGITEDGKFKANYSAPKWLAEELGRLAADPEKETRLYGRITGVCCCCARELTDPVSVAAGIGPICAETWGV